MTLFFIFLTCGLAELWLLLVMWGFAAGVVNAVPYVTLVGCLALSLAAAPGALFFTRISAALALSAVALTLAWPVGIAISDSVIQALPFALLPVTAASAAIRRLWRTRRTPWLDRAVRPRAWIRVALCGLPIAVFALLFNARLVLALLLDGPPK